MSKADGSIVFVTELDDKETQQKLTRLTKRIDTLQDSVSKNKALKLPLVEQADALTAKLDAAKAKLYEMQQAGMPAEALKEQQETVNAIQNEWNGVVSKIERYDKAISASEQETEWAKNKAGELAQKLSEAGYSAEEMKRGIKKADDSMKKFAARLKAVVRSALVFTVITQALRGFRNWLGDVIKATPEASAAVAKLKGALLTMVQPLVNVIIPAFTTLVNVLTAVVGKLAEVFAFLAGTTVESSAQAAEALNEQTEALNSTGSAAKKAGKSLASFDEINKLSSTTESGGTSSSEIAPDFGFSTDIALDFTGIGDMTFLTDRMQTIAEDIKAIFSDVKSFISNVFSGDWDDAIQNIMDFCNDISQLLRDLVATADELFGSIIDGIIEKFDLAGTPIGEMLEGIKGMVHNTVEMINDIVDHNWEKLAEDFGGFLDSFRTFVNGIFELGKKIISSLLDWLDEKTHGRFSDIIGTVKQLVIGLIDSAKEIFNGFTDFLIGIFTGDWERAWLGVKKVFRGIFSAVVMIFESAINLIIKGLNWTIDKMNALLAESFIAKGLELVSVDFTGIPNIPKVDLVSKIPALAQGAVIPPNREFLAVLGDQKSGTNIETPLPTMIQAFKQALAEVGYSGQSEAYLMLDDIQLGKVIYRLNKREGNRIGVSLVGV